MNLEEGLKTLVGRPAIIPECSRDDIPDYCVSKGFKVGVEVGVFTGLYTEVMARSGMQIYGVDPWMDYKGYEYGSDQKLLDRRYREAVKRLEPYSNVTILRKTSMEALDDFEDESVDYVYIDANHRFKYVAEDIMGWGRKLKQGGILAGHDYALFKHRYVGGGCQVREVVDAYSRSFELDFWVLGRRDDKIRDHMRSWLFVKTWKNL